ncbi:MAG: 5-(carboxyamino)imidazole ribonucleotide mutase, partial [Proteobacteria bacterium]|nr:5-(carboxyamino)imidazole ribonucleotide mutase [Pseudomonadota bacterium]
MSSNNVEVLIMVGSDSDLATMDKCLDILKDFGIGFECRVSSAHRTPDETIKLVTSARNRGIKVIIAAAGMAAHLAGVSAAHTTLPVIGVPMVSGSLQGFDALLSTVQMPPGIPVATVGTGSAGAKNAALLAIQIMGVSDSALADKMAKYKKDMAEAVK